MASLTPRKSLGSYEPELKEPWSSTIQPLHRTTSNVVSRSAAAASPPPRSPLASAYGEASGAQSTRAARNSFLGTHNQCPLRSSLRAYDVISPDTLNVGSPRSNVPSQSGSPVPPNPIYVGSLPHLASLGLGQAMANASAPGGRHSGAPSPTPSPVRGSESTPGSHVVYYAKSGRGPSQDPPRHSQTRHHVTPPPRYKSPLFHGSASSAAVVATALPTGVPPRPSSRAPSPVLPAVGSAQTAVAGHAGNGHAVHPSVSSSVTGSMMGDDTTPKKRPSTFLDMFSMKKLDIIQERSEVVPQGNRKGDPYVMNLTLTATPASLYHSASPFTEEARQTSESAFLQVKEGDAPSANHHGTSHFGRSTRKTVIKNGSGGPVPTLTDPRGSLDKPTRTPPERPSLFCCFQLSRVAVSD